MGPSDEFRDFYNEALQSVAELILPVQYFIAALDQCMRRNFGVNPSESLGQSADIAECDTFPREHERGSSRKVLRRSGGLDV